MTGEQVLQPIQDLMVQLAQEVVLRHIADLALHQNTQDQALAREAAQVIHGQARVQAVVQVTQDQVLLQAVVQAIPGQALAHEAAQATHGQARVQATQDQAPAQATQNQARLQGVVPAIHGQALVHEAAQVTHGQVPVRGAAQVTQDQALLHVVVHHPEGPAAVRAGHPAEAQDPAAGDKKQFTYYYFLKHLSNT